MTYLPSVHDDAGVVGGTSREICMNVRVRYLGGLHELITHTREEEVTTRAGATIAELLTTLATRHPGLAETTYSIRVAVNGEVVTTDDLVLVATDEIALLPPVAGGCDVMPQDDGPWCRLCDTPLDVGEVLRGVKHPSCGAIVTFIGTVRDTNDGRSVDSLAYEVFAEMALGSLDSIVRRCEAESPGLRVTVAHRFGLLQVGDLSVIVAASAPHRAEAFHAASMCIELLKQETPIWKRETSPEGAIWIGMGS